MQLRGTLAGHGGWVTQIATTQEVPDMILSASRGWLCLRMTTMLLEIQLKNFKHDSFWNFSLCFIMHLLKWLKAVKEWCVQLLSLFITCLLYLLFAIHRQDHHCLATHPSRKCLWCSQALAQGTLPFRLRRRHLLWWTIRPLWIMGWYPPFVGLEHWPIRAQPILRAHRRRLECCVLCR